MIADQERASAVVQTHTPRESPVTSADPWAALVQTGVTLLEQIAAASRASSPEPSREGLRFVRRDPQTGQDYLRIPMPSAEVLDRAMATLGEMLERFRR